MELFYGNILMLLTQCVIIGLLILFLFRLRLIFGLGLLWILLGTFQFLQLFLSNTLFIEITPTISVSSGSMVLFTGSLFAVLLIHICEGLIEARKIIYAILATNLVLILLLVLGWWSFRSLDTNNSLILNNEYFSQNILFLSVGTLILVLDFFVAISIYELISKYLKTTFFKILITMCIVLTMDAILISFGFYWQNENYLNLLVSGIVFKNLAVLIYTFLFTVYLTYIEPRFNTAKGPKLSFLNIFQTLTFFKRYEGAILELQLEKERTSNLENVLNDISDGLVSLDTNWCYTYVNKKAGELINRKPSSLIGKNIWEEFPGSIGIPFYTIYHKAVETQETQYLKEYYEPFNKWFENRIYPSSKGLTIYFTDITERVISNALLVKSEKNLDNIINNIGDPLFVKDDQSRIQIVNDAFCKMFSLTRDNIIGKTLAEDVTPEERENFLKIDKQVIANGIEDVSEESLTVRDSETLLISTKKTRFIDENGTKFLIGIIRDITEKKKADTNNQMLLSLVETSDDFIGLASLKGEPIYLNKMGKKMVGLELDEVLPETIEAFFPKHYHDTIVNEHRHTINHKNKWHGEAYFKHFKTGDLIPIEMSGFLIRDNITKTPIALGVVATNITERKKVELELEKNKNNLEELVESRTSELEKEKIKAQSADSIKSVFLATMSHELRTPMNSIIGFTGILLKELAGPLNEEQKKQIGMVKNSGEHLLGLINDILDFSKIEAGKLKITFHSFDYLASLEKTIDFLLPQAAAKELKIITEINEMEITLVSEERRVEQILLNLLSNAIKFSKKGTICIKVDVLNGVLVTQVIDEGIGINEEDVAKLFMPFTQLEGKLNRNHTGTGLGLAISKNLIEKLGGTIELQSKIGKGSNFTFKIPLERPNNKY